MAIWQKIAVSRALNTAFTEEKQSKNIKEAFKEICSPLEGTKGIEIGEDYLKINEKEYKLIISPYKISIKYNSLLKGIQEASFVVNEKRQVGYSLRSNSQIQWSFLDDYYFDYEEILNNLMDYVITNN